MTRRELPWCAAGGMLIVCLALEWMPFGAASPTAAPSHTLHAPKMKAADRIAVAANEATVLARPLFSEHRRASLLAIAAEGSAQNLPRLAGIVLGTGYRRAIFEAAGVRPISVAQDGAVGGWHVALIDPDSVVLADGDRHLRLTPSLLAAITPPPPKRDPWTTPRATGLLRARWSNSQYQP